MKASNVHDSRLMRAGFLVLGIAALLLGLMGVFLPILPTAPFILLAAACFARGSERLHDWLLAQRIAGRIIRDWQQYRSLPPGVKPWAFLMMTLSFGISIVLVDSLWHRVILATIAAILAVLLWRVPVRNWQESVRSRSSEV